MANYHMKPYPAYRPSRVEGLGEVPEHWDVIKLGRIGSFSKGGGGSKEDETEDGVPCVRYGDLYTVHQFAVRSTRANISQESAMRYTRMRYGDLLFAGSGETIEEIGRSAVNLIDDPAYCGGDVILFHPSVDINAMFLGYTADSSHAVYQKSCMGRGVTVMHIYASELKHFQLAIPPLAEQRTIAAFLDRITERIDAVVAKMRLSVERLQEYRTALITRTVTRGLPPDAARAAGLDSSPRLKPSGVEWLGDVPEHWEVIENRRLFTERDERSDDGEGELLTVSHITGVTRRSEKPGVGMFMAESLAGYKTCYTGDFVINTMWAWMGATGTAREAGLVSPSYNVYTPDPRKLLQRFVDLAYRSARYVLGMTSESRGIWTSRLRLYPQQFLSLVTAIPPLEEQQAIISHVDQIESESLRIIEAVEAAIERLQEYRTALITAAVTGKVDVREAVAADGS